MIRDAAASDLDRLVAIETLVFETDRLDRRALRHAVGSPTILARVAERDGAVAGYALAQTRRGSTLARLTSLAVLPDRAGGGLGRALVESCERGAAAAGCDRMRLEVRADNARAVALYERAGYARLDAIAEYYEDGGAALRLEKRLAPAG